MRNFMVMSEKMFLQKRFLCVGLDTDWSKIPEHLKTDIPYDPDVVVKFNLAIIRAVADIVGFVKLNSAFYEQHSFLGIEALARTIKAIRKEFPELVIILDAKRADIDNTNLGYVGFQDLMLADAITVHPYLGSQAMKPFLDRPDKGVIVLCRTSNKGAGQFQDLPVLMDTQEFPVRKYFESKLGYQISGPTILLYMMVAKAVVEEWNGLGNCCVVAGATYPQELADIRAVVGNMPILIPGIGAQGGDVLKTVRAAGGKKMIINNSRGIIFASNGEDFAEKAREAAIDTNDKILAAIAEIEKE